MNEPGFDATPHGEEMIALLRRHAPPRCDAKAASLRVMQRLDARPQRTHVLAWLAPLGLAAAACAVVAVMVFAPVDDRPQTPAPSVAAHETPGELSPFNAVPAGAVVSVRVRSVSGEVITLDAGLTRGLRTGDLLQSGQSQVRVTAAGIFVSHGRVESGSPPQRGERFWVEALTPAMRRMQQFEFVGGDAGALYDFGAVFESLPLPEARRRGLASGRALVVVETIGSLLRGEVVEPSLAGRLGLQAQDVLLQVNGQSIENLNELLLTLEQSRQNGALRFRVLRGAQEVELATK